MKKEYKPIEGITNKLAMYYYVNIPENAKAVVLVIHGMMEHSNRYSHLRESLAREGFGFAAMDLPGHGKSINEDEGPGVWPENGMNNAADEVGDFIRQLKDSFNLPVILFGHSMGSFISLGILERYGNDLSACILSGTNDRQPGLLLNAGKFFASLIISRKGYDYKSKFLHNMAFGSYNKKIKPIRTDNDWLSTDATEVDKYINDPLCGFYCSASLYKDLSEWLMVIYKDSSIANIPEELPVYIFSGGEDPVGNYGKGVASLRNRLIDSGIKNVILHMYEGKRHECLNEVNKQEVLGHINDFCNEMISERN